MVSQGEVFRIGSNDGAWRLVIPVIVIGADGRRLGTHALLDGGSTRHVVSSELCEDLGIKGERIRMSVTTLDRVVEGEREVADVAIQGVNGLPVMLANVIFGQIVASRGDSPPQKEDVVGLRHLEGVEFPQFAEGERVERKIGVIIGAEHAWIWTTGMCLVQSVPLAWPPLHSDTMSSQTDSDMGRRLWPRQGGTCTSMT